MKRSSKIIAILVVFCIIVILSDRNNRCYANRVDEQEMIDCLVENGYVQETAEALCDNELDSIYKAICNGILLNVTTCAEEIDALEEIEYFYSYEEENLEDMGMKKSEIEELEEQYENLFSMPDEDLKKKYDMDDVEIKAMRRAKEKGEENKINDCKKKHYGKEITNQVTASGSLSKSEVKYSQSVISNSKKVPNYRVNLSFSWTKPYVTRWFKDKIVAAWGGGLTTKGAVGVARYADWKSTDGGWLKYDHSKKMKIDESDSIDMGIEFTFPQGDGKGRNGTPEAKHGSATFILYQTKKEGKKTKIISYFAHRKVAVVGGSVDIKATPSISFGTAWETTSKKSTDIKY